MSRTKPAGLPPMWRHKVDSGTHRIQQSPGRVSTTQSSSTRSEPSLAFAWQSGAVVIGLATLLVSGQFITDKVADSRAMPAIDRTYSQAYTPPQPDADDSVIEGDDISTNTDISEAEDEPLEGAPDMETPLAEVPLDQLVSLRSCNIYIPSEWDVARQDSNGRESILCSGPFGMELLFEVAKSEIQEDPKSNPQHLERALKKASNRRYEPLALASDEVGSVPVARWEFRLSKEVNGIWEEPRHKLGVYSSSGLQVAVLASCPESYWETARPLLEKALSTLTIPTSRSSAPNAREEFDSRLLDESDLMGKTAYELSVMRNEIYARHGLIFRREEFAKYFSKKPWYKPKSRDLAEISKSMSTIEKANAKRIRDYQESNGLNF